MFIYTSCTDICPLTTARMTLIEDKLGAPDRQRFLHRLDDGRPGERHAGEAEGLFEGVRTGPGWTFVTGKPEDIRAINYRLGERSKVLERAPQRDRARQRRHRRMAARQRDGRSRRASGLRSARWIRNSASRSSQVRANPAMNTGLAMGTQPGQAMYKKVCAACHTIGVGDKVGPDLRGVTERRDRAWLVSYLRNPLGDAGEARSDRAARSRRSSVVRMPNMRALRAGCRRPDQLPA